MPQGWTEGALTLPFCVAEKHRVRQPFRLFQSKCFELTHPPTELNNFWPKRGALSQADFTVLTRTSTFNRRELNRARCDCGFIRNYLVYLFFVVFALTQ